MSVPDPLLELGLAAIILISSLIIGINVIKQSPRRADCYVCKLRFQEFHSWKVLCGLRRTAEEALN